MPCNNIPLIDSYEAFVNFNNLIKSQAVPSISIDSIDYKNNTIVIIMNNEKYQYVLDDFIYNFVYTNSHNSNPRYLEDSSLVLLCNYNFAKLYHRTHYDEFIKRILDYGQSLLALGETSFELFDFEVSLCPLINIESVESSECQKRGVGIKVLKYIGDTSKSHIDIPYGVTHIGTKAFEYCRWLKTISLPSTLKEIGANAFSFSQIKRIHIPDSVEIIQDAAFACCHIRHLSLPNNLKHLGSSVFLGTDLEEITIPNGIEEIPAESFKLCADLHYIEFSKNLKRIGEKAFYKTGLTHIEIPDSVETIGDEAFAGAYIKEIIVPESVKTIGIRAFADCIYLEKVKLPKNVELGSGVFDGTEIGRIEDIKNNIKGVFKNIRNKFLK